MPGVGTTHHLQLGGHFYIVKPGSYQKRVAPQFGARFTTGDPDYNNLSVWQHWAQRCWVGGMDAELWADDAMYDDGVGVDTTEHEVVTLSRDLAKGTGANWTVSKGTTAATYGYKTCIYNQKLYVVTIGDLAVSSVLWEYDPATDGWASMTSPGMTVRCIAAYDGKLFLGGRNTANSAPILKFSTGAISSWTTVTNPAGVSNMVFSMRAFQQKLYVAYGATIWRMKDDQTWDGNTAFYKANMNSESNEIRSMETHLGFLYLLSNNGHLHRTDGNSTFDIWSWDGQTTGVAIKSFDGRLFIATYEYTNTADVGYGVLYQMTGSAMTELKRWGKPTQSNVLGSLVVYDRLLFYGASNLLGMTNRDGFGVAAYDPVEDAHSIVASNTDTVLYPKGSSPYRNFIVDDVIFFQGKMFAFVRGHGAFVTPYIPRDRREGAKHYDITSAGGSVAATNGGWFTSSTYDAGTPGLRKLWRKVCIDYSLPATSTSLYVEYSVDGGLTWVALGPVTTAGSDIRKRKEFWLENVISVSLKLRITLRSTDNTKTPQLLGWLVSYLPVVEPNWMWTFTIVLASKLELLDGTVSTVDTEAELAFLRDSYRTKQLLNFADADGTVWASGGQAGVLIYDLTFHLLDLNQPLEGEVQVTLLEAVETY